MLSQNALLSTALNTTLVYYCVGVFYREYENQQSLLSQNMIYIDNQIFIFLEKDLEVITIKLGSGINYSLLN